MTSFEGYTKIWRGWESVDAEFAETARSDEHARRLTTIPGIGALNATALVAAIGDVATFARGRDLAAWLGLVPRQLTTGGRPKLVGITKRGSKYLRKSLIQGARGCAADAAADSRRYRGPRRGREFVLRGRGQLSPDLRICLVWGRGFTHLIFSAHTTELACHCANTPSTLNISPTL